MSAGENGEVLPSPDQPGLLPDREVFEFALDAHLLTDPHGLILDANAAASHLFQVPGPSHQTVRAAQQGFGQL